MPMQTDPTPAAVIDFWREAGYEKWFKADPEFDKEVRERFARVHEAASAGTLDSWASTAEGALALVIVLDQFSRNIFRGTARAFATDAAAREVARQALARNFDREVDPAMRGFFFLPFMHSENLADQEYCVELYRAIDDEEGIKFAEIHRDAIARFGRFPHRNEMLGRKSSADEIAYLDAGGFRG
jgi:uncharacterized protein (DUF924 family)